MNYQWDKIIAADETVKQEFSISARYRHIMLAFMVLCGVIIFFDSYYIGLFIFFIGWLYWFYLKKAKHYAFTNRRIILVESFLGNSTISIDYDQITDIEIEQSTLDQIGGWGTVAINTAGTHSPKVRLQFIDNPQLVKQQLDEIRDTGTTNIPEVIGLSDKEQSDDKNVISNGSLSEETTTT